MERTDKVITRRGLDLGNLAQDRRKEGTTMTRFGVPGGVSRRARRESCAHFVVGGCGG